MVLAFKNTGDLKIKEGKFEEDKPPTVKFPAKITKERDGKFRAEVAIKGFRFDQSGTGAPQVFDVYAMQVGGVKVIGDGDTVAFSISCEAKGMTTAKWEGHLNVLVIADIAESPPTGSPPTGSPPTG
jgi:cold shock CspA family protein